jgi:class 3 adenylate cyclase
LFKDKQEVNMHREFKELLKDATGMSEYVIAVNLDIRGFSSFSKKVESPDVAVFIKKVYLKLLDGYFPNASFFKPTGDGLLLTIPYNESNLQANVRQTIDSSLEITKTFCTFCENDPMITFETPKKIGIGLSRGTACCLISQDKIMDYSGRVLNLASRLMDVARPSGIVFDAVFGEGLLSDG